MTRQCGKTATGNHLPTILEQIKAEFELCYPAKPIIEQIREEIEGPKGPSHEDMRGNVEEYLYGDRDIPEECSKEYPCEKCQTLIDDMISADIEDELISRGE